MGVFYRLRGKFKGTEKRGNDQTQTLGVSSSCRVYRNRGYWLSVIDSLLDFDSNRFLELPFLAKVSCRFGHSPLSVFVTICACVRKASARTHADADAHAHAHTDTRTYTRTNANYVRVVDACPSPPYRRRRVRWRCHRESFACRRRKGTRFTLRCNAINWQSVNRILATIVAYACKISLCFPHPKNKGLARAVFIQY